MKKAFKRIYVLLIALLLFTPTFRVFAALDTGDVTIKMRIAHGSGCYRIQTADGEESSCEGDKVYHVPDKTEVTVIAEPAEGYFLEGWYPYADEEGDIHYSVVPVSREVSYTFTADALAEGDFYTVAPAFVEGTELKEIRFTGKIETESLEEGNLPSYSVETKSEGVVIDTTKFEWGKLANPDAEWTTLGENPVAEDDGSFYAMKVTFQEKDDYVFTENTKIYYNDRDMYDTYTAVVPTTDGYEVYLDLGQVFHPQGPSVEGNTIYRIDLGVEIPRIGDEITLLETEEGFTQTQYGVQIPEEDIEYYGIDGDEEHNYMYLYDSETGDLVSGKLVADHTYGLVIWLVSFEGYEYAENLEIFVNGEYIEKDYFHIEGERLGIDYQFTPDPADKTYTLETEEKDYIAVFDFPEGTDFELTVFDILKIDPEVLQTMFTVSTDFFEEAINAVKKNIREYGDLLGLYAISIDGPGIGYSSALTFKIKMTEEMKAYNTFKFLFLDENNEFVVQEVHDTDIETIDGVDYIVVQLDHLSAYALVGSNVTEHNPGTGDPLLFYLYMLGLTSIGLIGTGIYTKKKKYF